MARILGIDIGANAVHAAFIQSTFRTVKVESYESHPLVETESDESRRDAIREVVTRLLATPNRSVEIVVAALEGSAASLRVLELPSGAAKQLDQVLPFEVEPLVPFEVADAVIDHQPVSKTPLAIRILACAVPKAKVRARLDALREVGVEPRELAVGAAALDGLTALIPALTVPGPVALLHFAPESTELCVLENGRTVLARTLDDGADAILRGRGAAVVSAIKRTLTGHRATGGAPLVAAYVSGMSSVLDHGFASLADALEVEVLALPMPEAAGADERSSLEHARALALAARPLGKGHRLNLRRGEFAPPRAIGSLRENARVLGVCGALILVSFLFSVFARKSLLEEEHAKLVERLTASSRELFSQPAETAEQARALMGGQERVEDPLPRFDAFDVLTLLSEKIAPSIIHTTERLAIEMDDESREGRFELQGTVPSITDRDTIALALDTHECVEAIERGPTSPVAGGEPRQSYRIEAHLQCPGDEPLTRTRHGAQRNRNEGH